MDAEGHLTQQTAGNGLLTVRSFNATTGRLTNVSTGSGNAVQSQSYTYDLLGNPLSRSDANTNLSESFAYNALNRLTSTTVNLTPTPLFKSFSYSAIGNVLSKSDVGNYSYAPPGSPLPHAVTSTSGGSISTTFSYDPNGNQTAGLGRNIVYTSYNKPASITQGTRTISFQDDTEHQRFKQVTPEGTTLYIAAFGVLAEVSNPGTASAKWTEYLSVGNAKVGMRTLQVATSTLTTRYFHTDHLGSISVITNETGAVVERLSYDAWGKRRNADGSDDTTGSITSQTPRGFTGEEELSVSGLVHLNGRVYDPLLARFTSADPTVTDPMNAQGWNRYSYVGNDPLAFTDPNGFSWLSRAWHSVEHAVSSAWNGVTHFFATNAIARSILQIGTTILLATILGPQGALASLALSATAVAVTAAVGGAIIATGLSGGNLGQTLKAGAIAGLTAFAFYEVGSLTPGAANAAQNPGMYAANVAGHAAVGCASSVASGGSCGSGALSGAVGSALSPLTSSVFQSPQTDLGDRIGGTMVSAVAGGLASVAGGGKFANGAVTGAFGYLFNQAAHGGNDPNERHQMGVDAAMKDYLDRGYIVIRDTPVAVTVPGFATPRYYDFLVQDPGSGYNIGVEVKTTLYDTIRLSSDQVAKDVTVMQQGGYSARLDLPVNGVGYTTFCWGCSMVDIRSNALNSSLQAAGVPFTHGGRPGEIR